jgi:hypothetical protein
MLIAKCVYAVVSAIALIWLVWFLRPQHRSTELRVLQLPENFNPFDWKHEFKDERPRTNFPEIDAWLDIQDPEPGEPDFINCNCDRCRNK